MLPTESTLATFLAELTTIKKEVHKVPTIHLNKSTLRKRIKIFVADYFEKVRPELLQSGAASGGLDSQMQDLLRMTHGRNFVSSYKKQLEAIHKEYIQAEISVTLKKSDALAIERITSVPASTQDKAIIDTLEKLVPHASACYKQALADLKHLDRISYRGTAAELRETLREVLDTLGPDKEVMALPGFKLEKNAVKPTMRQKARYILKKRQLPETSMIAPIEAADMVENSVAKLARGTYDRGSNSAHTNQSRNEILQIKRYLDSVLCELLEIHLDI